MPISQLTKQQWVEELELAISSRRRASHWRVNKATVEQSSPMCHAELADTIAGKVRTVVLARDRFATREMRIAESTRQVQTGVDPRRHETGV